MKAINIMTNTLIFIKKLKTISINFTLKPVDEKDFNLYCQKNVLRASNQYNLPDTVFNCFEK